ncbi:MAG TPA: phenylalanine--tRNA ligase subunit beta [Burkholderiales bacterium]|nr:phenylalanine--tRNA ligase subunit beta [Burkholderiales bacterium]
MKFSENWLRTLVNPSLDSEALAHALTMAGLEVEELAPALDDKILTLKLTPNRADCLSVNGVAREVAAITASSLKTEPIKPAAVTVSDSLQVKVAEPQACPRYCGRVVRGVNPGAATPAWMARRLERSGVRSLNALVDITNYVMLEQGQPLHAFDLAKIKGGIHVRYARKAEELVLLNEKKLALTPDLLVIADEAKPLALAGIMGGLESAVNGKTQNVFLESAFFSPEAVAGKSRILGFATDSSHRFERGVDFAATREALERATQLILEICGGEAGPVTEASAGLPKRDPIRLRVPRVQKVLGIALDSTNVSGLLRRLQFSFAEERDVFYVTPHSYRFDLAIEEDLIEELARIHGYDEIPVSLPKARQHMLSLKETRRDEAGLRKRLIARDYQEVITYSFVDAQWEADFCGNSNPIRLINPIASQMGVMRSSLIASLTDCLRGNLNRKQPRARLFEISRCFTKDKSGYAQPEKLAGLCYGLNLPEQWGAPQRSVDFFDVKADLEALFWPLAPRFVAGRHPALHPGRAAQVWAGERLAGWVGELHPQLQHKYELPQPPVVFELELEVLMQRELPLAQEVSKFPPVRRDIAVVVDAQANVQAMLESLQAGKPLAVTEIALFDLYQGEGIDSGKKSLAFRVLLQDTQKTFTDAEVEAAVAQLKQILQQEYHAKLRI